MLKNKIEVLSLYFVLCICQCHAIRDQLHDVYDLLVIFS